MLGFIGCGASWLVTVALHFSDGVAPVGIAWLLIGMVVYVVYRRTQHLPLTETVLAQRVLVGPAVEVEYRSILLPLTAHRVTDEMTATALRLAAESGTKLVALYPIPVPMNLPLSAPMDADVHKAERRAAGGGGARSRVRRGRDPAHRAHPQHRRGDRRRGRQRRAEIIVLGARQRKRGGERMFGKVVDYVLRNADCRVMVGAQPAPV